MVMGIISGKFMENSSWFWRWLELIFACVVKTNWIRKICIDWWMEWSWTIDDPKQLNDISIKTKSVCILVYMEGSFNYQRWFRINITINFRNINQLRTDSHKPRQFRYSGKEIKTLDRQSIQALGMGWSIIWK